MGDQRAQRSNEGAWKYTETTAKSYDSVWELFAEAQNLQVWSTRSFLERTIDNLATQAERNLNASEELVEQVRKKQEASRVLARESANTYMEFLDNLFLYYQESARAAERAQERLSSQ